MLDLHRSIEFQHRVKTVETIGLGCKRHIVPGRQLLEIDPARPRIGKAAGRVTGSLQLLGVLEHLGPGLRNVGDASLFQSVQVDPHHGGRRIEGKRQHLALRCRVVASDGRQVGLRVELLAGLRHQLVDRLHRARRRHHGGGADLEHLHDGGRIAGAKRRDAGVHGVGVTPFVRWNHLVVALRGVEIVGELDDDFIVAAGHGMPPLDFRHRKCRRHSERQGERRRSSTEPSKSHQNPLHVGPPSSLSRVAAPDDVQMTASARGSYGGNAAGGK